jgi:FAD/FMN-containing dehydrogenase
MTDMRRDVIDNFKGKLRGRLLQPSDPEYDQARTIMGLTIDHLAGADIVTADGQLRHASAGEEPDLFWAIRGGGGNFGVVTTFEFALEPVGPEVTAGLMVFPFDQAKAVMTRYRDLSATMRNELTVWAILRQAPPLPFLAPEVHGKHILALAVFSPLKLDQVEAEIDTLRGFGQPVGEHIGPVPYTAWQQVLDPLLAPGARNYWKSHNFRTLPDAAIDTLIGSAGQLPTPQCEIFLGLLGGKAAEPAPDATAYPHRDAAYVANVHARWEAPADDAACISWARDFFKAAAPYAAGSVYINFLTQDEGARIQEAYGRNYDRLVEIKTRYDPRNLFRNNQNVPPRPAWRALSEILTLAPKKGGD